MHSRIAVLVLAAALASTARADAENYQPVRVDVVVLGAYGSGDVAAWGAGIAVEPKGNLTDHLAVGARIELSGLYSQSYDLLGLQFSLGGRGVFAFLAKADWYFTTSTARPFVGLGAGWYSMGSATSSVTGTSAQALSGFGIFPELGMNLGHFRMAVGYHLLLGGDQTVLVSGLPSNVSMSRDYLVFQIGGTFGGARTTPEAR